MNYSTLAKAAMFSLLGLLAAPAANATPIIYNYTLDVTATNISGLQDGTLNFTLSDAPTFLQELTLTNLRSEVTAFDAHIDGLDFTSISSCGANPMGCLTDLEFFVGGSLASLDYIGTNAGITF